jgi:phage tail sheath protein FI
LVEFKGEINRIAAVTDNSIVFEQAFTSDPVDAGLIPKRLVHSVETDVFVRCEGESEVYENVDLNQASPNYIARRLSASSIVSVTVAEDTALAAPAEVIFGKGENKGVISLDGGSDGSLSAVNAGVFIGKDNGPGARTGLEAFKENNIVSTMAIPGVTIPEVIVSLVTHCENLKDRFAVIDVPINLVKTGDIAKYRDMIDSTYAALYHPWIQVYDRLAQKPAFVPPSGAVLGVFSRTDIARGVHKAPANEVVSCTGLSTNYTSGEQDILNPLGVNLIRALPGQGVRIWGARTASSNSSFKYVSVRRLFIFVEESIRLSTNWVVFEPNNPSLWTRVQTTISTFLDTAFRAGMLAGDTPGQAYFVEVGPSTMSQDDILNGRLICNIGIAPVRPAEVVIFRVTQHTAEGAAA